jgi:hypothetical protein
MSANGDQHTAADELPRWDGHLVLPVFGIVIALVFVSFLPPIPF